VSCRDRSCLHTRNERTLAFDIAFDFERAVAVRIEMHSEWGPSMWGFLPCLLNLNLCAWISLGEGDDLVAAFVQVVDEEPANIAARYILVVQLNHNIIGSRHGRNM